MTKNQLANPSGGDVIHLLVTLDEGYITQLLVLLTSVFLNNPGQRFDLYMLHSRFPAEGLARIGRYCARFGWDFRPVEVEPGLFQDAPTSRRYPKQMYYRLLAAQLLPETLERVLYLDPDILVINPLRPLWQTDLDGFLFAAAAHTGKSELAGGVNRIRLKTDHDYYNSGVLLMNLAAGRAEIQPEELFRYVAEHGEKLLLPDQDMFNALYGGRTRPVDDIIWNYATQNHKSYALRNSGASGVAWVMEHTAILHFCGKSKPWKVNYPYRFGVLYQHYAQITRRVEQMALAEACDGVSSD